MKENNCALILAGGKGERFGKKKQFIDFMGLPLWKHVDNKISNIIPTENIIKVGIDIDGGETRSLSIINGLKALKTKRRQFERIIILESARPLVTEEQIIQLLDNESPSVTFVMPLVNTVIKRDGTYLNRNELYDLLTPQAFDFELLYQAYRKTNDVTYTDETKLMYDVYNIKPTFLVGGQNLVKLTYLKDLPILEQLFYLQKEGKI